MRAAIRASGVVRDECSILHGFVHFAITYQSMYYDLCTLQYILHCNQKVCFVLFLKQEIHSFDAREGLFGRTAGTTAITGKGIFEWKGNRI